MDCKIRELRTNKEEDAPIYLKTEMSSGHFSYSDRYKHVKETAFEYSFLLDQIKDQFLEKQAEEGERKSL